MYILICLIDDGKLTRGAFILSNSRCFMEFGKLVSGWLKLRENFRVSKFIGILKLLSLRLKSEPKVIDFNYSGKIMLSNDWLNELPKIICANDFGNLTFQLFD